MKKTLEQERSDLKIFLVRVSAFLLFVFILSTLVGCKSSWNWNPNPYAADHNTQSIYDAESSVISCEDIEFSDFTCFSSEDITSLKINIESVRANIKSSKMSKRKKSKLVKRIDNVLTSLEL